MIVKDVEIGLTTRCNLGKCAFCFRANCDTKVPNIDLDIEVAKRAFSKEFMRQLEILVICGNLGDPSLYPNLFDFIDHTSKLASDNLIVCMETNGTRNDPEWWKTLSNKMNQYKRYHVRFALDGLEDTHSLYRIGSDYNTVLTNMKAFISAGGRATWKFIVFKHNEHQVNEAAKLAKDLGCITFTVVASGIHNEKLKKSTKYQLVKSEGIICKSQDMAHVSIDADGEVMPCCYFRPFKNKLRGEKIFWDNPLLMIKYMKSKKDLNIHTSTIEKSTESEFFRYLYQHYRYIATCKNFCGHMRRRPDNVIRRRETFFNLDGTKLWGNND